MKLSERLETIISMVPKMPGGCKVADVGTDHGFVPIRLVKDGTACCALAMDVRQGPLLRAREHIQEAGLESVIKTRLSDGLAGLRAGEADCVVITGMGGELMLRIIRDGGHVRNSVRWWVLSPQSELSVFRHGLEELGLAICREVMLEEDGKFYTVMLVERGKMHYDRECCYRYGDNLIRSGSPELLRLLKREERQLGHILERLKRQESETAQKRRQEIIQELEEIRETYDVMQRYHKEAGRACAAISGL